MSHHRAAWVAGAVVLLLLVVGAVVAVVLPGRSHEAAGAPASSSASRPAGGSVSRPAGGSASAPVPGGTTDVGAELARWAGAELPAGAHLVAGPGVADALRRAGVPAGLVSGPPASGTALTVTDGAVPTGDRLVARFGDPPAFAVVDPAPVPPTADELRRRRDLAGAVLANPTTRVSGSAAAALRTAAVDPRLLGVLAALTARSGIGIAAMPAAQDEPADVPLARSALIDEVGGSPVTAGSPGVDALVAFLRAQLPPYAPDQVTVTPTGVLVRFRYLAAPDAAVTAASY